VRGLEHLGGEDGDAFELGGGRGFFGLFEGGGFGSFFGKGSELGFSGFDEGRGGDELDESTAVW
jgi:hypothetical protein